MDKKSLSKYLSLVLRHNPGVLGIALTDSGWAEVETLLRLMNESGKKVSMEALIQMVETNDKQRFKFNEDRTWIRASQGHSINIDLELLPVKPPEILYHGTAVKNLSIIEKDGIKKMSRQHVHLSADEITAHKVGSRHGSPVILSVQSGKMQEAGFLFYQSDNGVWLTDFVSPEFIVFPEK